MVLGVVVVLEVAVVAAALRAYQNPGASLYKLIIIPVPVPVIQYRYK